MEKFVRGDPFLAKIIKVRFKKYPKIEQVYAFSEYGYEKNIIRTLNEALQDVFLKSYLKKYNL